jgi:hypothetical protein
MGNTLGSACRETKAPCRNVAMHQGLKPRLMDRDLAGTESIDLVGIDVDAQDMVARIRQAGTGDQADIPCAEYRDAHDALNESSLKVDCTRDMKKSQPKHPINGHR